MKTLKTYEDFLNENLKDDVNYVIANKCANALKYYYDNYQHFMRHINGCMNLF